MLIFMEDFINWIMDWKKLTGIGIISAIILVIFILMFIGQDVAEVPTEVNQIKQEASDELISAGVEASTESSKGIISSFWKTGMVLADDVEDPGLKGTIIFGWMMAGVLLALSVVIAIMSPILKAAGMLK